MKLLGDMGHIESCLGPFGDGVSVCAREVHGLHQKYNRLSNRIARPMEFLGDVAHLDSCFGLFGHGVSVGAR
jgi:hypothetical protein